jgi:acylphosphatase
VAVACEAPPQACDGEEIIVTGIVNNCSDRPEDITVTIEGPNGPIVTTTIPNVPPGESVAFSEAIVHQCVGASTAYQVLAIAQNECGEATAVAQCVVECGPGPCVEVACEAPPQACDGEEIIITGIVINCSDRPEDIAVTIEGPNGPIVTTTFPNVPPGASVEFSEPVVHRCEGAATSYRVLAIAQNECGEATAVAECLVECGPGPCVQVACEAPAIACSGEEIVITGIVNNCSDKPVDIEVILNGPNGVITALHFPNVPPGETVVFEAPVAHQCMGEPVAYQILAIASNECGEFTAVAECVVECGPGPCVEVACETPPAACDGQEIVLTGVATNCSDKPEDIEVIINGPNGLITALHFPNVPPGETVVFEVPVGHQCMGEPVVYQIIAVASNECGEFTAVDECVVECIPRPCVEVACEAPPMGQSGEPIPIIAAAVNCSEGPEDITLTIHGPDGDILCQQTFPSVPAGSAVELLCEDVLECPDEGGPVVYFASATATNECGETQTALCETAVECEPPVQTVLKLFEADVDENGIRLSLELYEVMVSGSAIIHRGDSEDFKYAYAITPRPLQLSRTTLEFVDEAVSPGSQYWYWVELQEAGRTVAMVGPVAAVAARPGVTLTFVSPVHPNPTAGAAVFRYTVGSDIAGGGDVPVSLAIYDSRGRLVKTLVSGSQPVGAYTAQWDGRGERGGKVPPGVYYYRFSAGSYSHRSSVVMLK